MSKVFILPHETSELLNQWGHFNRESTQQAIKYQRIAAMTIHMFLQTYFPLKVFN